MKCFAGKNQIKEDKNKQTRARTREGVKRIF